MRALSACLLLSLVVLTSAQAQQATELRLGVFPNVTHAAALVGIDTGIFQQRLGNVRLVVKRYSNGTEINNAFKAGEIDAAYVGPGPAMNAFMKGQPLQVYAGAANAGAVLVRRYGSGIGRLTDLAGKKVAVPTRGSTQDISLRHMLHQVGMAATDEGGTVSIIPMKPADMPAAFKKNEVDAALVQEPWGTIMELQGAKLLANEKEIWANGNYTTTVLVFATPYAAQNQDTVRNMLKGHLEAINLALSSEGKTYKAVTNQIYAMTQKRPGPSEMIQAMRRTYLTWDINVKTLNEYAELNKEAGFSKVLPDMQKFLNLTIIRELVKSDMKYNSQAPLLTLPK